MATLMMAIAYWSHAGAQPLERCDYSSFIKKYRGHILTVMKDNAIAGASIAVVDRDSMIWCEGFGFFDNATRKPVSGHTPFFIGSICKTFTGLAVMQLAEQRKIDLDAPLTRYIPTFSMKSRFGSLSGVTIRSIMTHHAGIPDFAKDKLSASPPPFETVLSIVNDDYATFAPNTIFSYSNAGISLLGNVIEEVTGESYFDYLWNHLLQPMHMKESGFFEPGQTPESVELGYNSKGQEIRELPVIDAPAGCVYSSAFDMAKFIQAILRYGQENGGRILDSASLAEMMRVQNDSVFLDFGAPTGLVWSVYFNAAGRCIEHAGGSIAHRAELCIAPECGLGIIMMSNSALGGRMMYAENYEMFADLMAARHEQAREQVGRKPKNMRHPQHDFVWKEGERPSLVPVDDATLQSYAGQYGSFGYYFPLELKKGSLHTVLFGKHLRLLPVEHDEFVPLERTDSTATIAKTRLYFERAEDALLLVQIDQWGNHSILGERIVPFALTERWRKRTGDYTADQKPGSFQMFSNFSLIHTDGVLSLEMNFNIEGLGPPTLVAPLRVVNDSLAVVYGYGRFSGQAVQFHATEGTNDLMKFMGYTCTKK